MTITVNKSNWKTYRFDEIAENIAVRVDNPSEAGVERYVGLEHLDPGVLTVQRWASPEVVTAQKLRFWPGDVIFGRRRAYQKKVAQADFEGVCSAHALVLRAKPGTVTEQFLPVFLSSDYFLDRAISISVGSMSPTVNWRDLRKQEFLLPPLDEQQRIANLFWQLEESLSSLTEYKSEQWRSFSKWMEQEFSHACGEPTPLRDTFSHIIGGKWGDPADVNEVNLRALGPSVYQRGPIFNCGEDLPIRSQSKSSAAKRILKEGDIVLERSGGTLTQPVGRVIMIGDVSEQYTASDFQRLLRPDREKVVPGYIFWKMWIDWQNGETVPYQRRTTNIANLNIPEYLSRSINLPSLEKQKTLVLQINETLKKAEPVEGELRDLSRLKTLLSGVFFGGFDVH